MKTWFMAEYWLGRYTSRNGASETWGATSTDVYALRRHSTRNSRSSAPQTRTVTLRSSGGGTWKPLLSQIPSFARPSQGRQLAGPATQTQATGCKSRDNQEKRRWFRCVIDLRDIQRYSSAIVGYKLIEDVEIHVALGSESKSVAERRKRGCRQRVVSI